MHAFQTFCASRPTEQSLHSWVREIKDPANSFPIQTSPKLLLAAESRMNSSVRKSWLQPISVGFHQLPSVVIAHIQCQTGCGPVEALVNFNNQREIGTRGVCQTQRKQELHLTFSIMWNRGLVISASPFFSIGDHAIQHILQDEGLHRTVDLRKLSFGVASSICSKFTRNGLRISSTRTDGSLK